MSDILSALTTFFKAVFGGTVGTGSDAVTYSGFIGTVVDAIVDNPLILLFVISGFVGVGIGIVKRLASVN